MTRHNLDEHLSWLLHAKPSLPPKVNNLPPASATFSDPRSSQVVSPLICADESGLVFSSGNVVGDLAALHTPKRRTQPGVVLIDDEETMVRERVTPHSKPKETRFCPEEEPYKSSAPSVLRSQQKSGHVRDDQRNTPNKTAASSRAIVPDSPNDAEIMDLTEMSGIESPTPIRSSQIRGQKRKSGDFEADLDSADAPGKQGVRHVKQRNGDSGNFPAIDEYLADSPDQAQPDNVPRDPPPPYSTVPPLRRSSAAILVAHAAPVQSPPAGAIIDHVTAESDAEDNLVNFARPPPLGNMPDEHIASTQKPRTAISSHQTPQIQRSTLHTDVHNLSSSLALTPQLTSQPPTEKGLAIGSTQKITGANVEDSKTLQAFFTLGDISITIDRLEARREELCVAVAQSLDEEHDAEDIEMEIDALDSRKAALEALWARRSTYKKLLDERNRSKDSILHAVRIRDQNLKNTAVAESQICKGKLQACERECSLHLTHCREDVNALVNVVQQTTIPRAADTSITKTAQKTPARESAQERPLSSSNRIAQTQLMPPPPVFRDSDSFFGHQRIDRKQTSHQVSISHAQASDDDGFDDIHDHEMLAIGDHIHSNRMGTPPPMFIEEDEYGMEDDADVFDGLEDQNVVAYDPAAPTERRVFAETSGNRITKPISATKPKRMTAKILDEVEKRNFNFPWSQDVMKTLKQRFKLRGFRENQVEAINATLGGKDAFVLMPTGGGKSLCYQLPALVNSGQTRGVTVVISPLVSLMEDQVTHLINLGIQAFFINSQTPRDERNALLDALRGPDVEQYVQLLYVTPEMLSKSQAIMNVFEHLFRRQRLARLVIDEAHCVSQWGHDFRPDYKALGEVRRKYQGVPVMALTATATENVKVDIIHNLGMAGCQVLTRSFNRPNLFYEVRAKGKGKEDLENIANIIKESHRKQTGIIYCLSRKNCEDMAQALVKEHRIKAHHYHAGLDAAQRSEIQKQWQSGTHQVIVATIAFGMGIDKANVRFVIHQSLPKSLEGYYQETGRAGRDGQPSQCYLFYGYADAGKLRKMIDEGEGSWEQKDRQHQMLRKMVQFCDNKSDCRRVQILSYFNESFSKDDCNAACDNCTSGSAFQTVDLTDYARAAVELVREIVKRTENARRIDDNHRRNKAEGKVTILQCMDIFRGAATKKYLEAGYDNLDQYGAAGDLDRGDIERLFYRLLNEGVLQEDNVANAAGFTTQYVRVGRNCNKYSGSARFEMQIRTSSTPRANKSSKATAKKRAKKDPKEGQSRNWNKTAGSKDHRQLPISTNVSSPVQAESSRGQSITRSKRGEAHLNGYHRDDFVVSDPADEDYEDESDGFEPIQVGNRLSRSKPTRKLGPPITTDAAMEKLDDIHKLVVEDFVQHAERKCKEIQSKRNLQAVPFSNTILRDMAIGFTQTGEEMLQIRGIDPERVKLYGRHFYKLVQDARQRYDEMMQTKEEGGSNQHALNVIDLLSSDEEDASDEFDELSSDVENAGEEADEQSKFFQQRNANVAAFNAKFRQSQSQGIRVAPFSESQSPKTKRTKKTHYRAKGSTGRASAGSNHGRNRGSFGRARSGAGVIKKKSAPRRSNSTAGPSRGNANRGGAPTGYGNISMMPT